MKKYFEFNDGKSSKFWSVAVEGGTLTVQYGKIGTAGQVQEKFFGSQEEAEKEAGKLIKSKTSKGYAEMLSPASLVTEVKKEAKQKVEPPKTKVKKLPEAGVDVEDKGQNLAWHDEEDYCYGDDDAYAFDIAYLRTPEVVEVQPVKKSVASKGSEKVEAPSGFNAHAYGELMKALDSTVRSGRGKSVPELVASIRKLNPPAEMFKKGLVDIFCEQILDDGTYDVALQHIDFLALLVEAGVDIPATIKVHEEEGYYDESDVKDFFRHMFIKFGEKQLTPADVVKLSEQFFTEIYADATERIVQMLMRLADKVKAGKHEDIKGTRLPETVYGLKVNVDSSLSIYSIGSPSKCLISERNKKTDDIKGHIVKHFMTPLLKPRLEKLLKEGFFNDLISSGYFVITFYNDKEPLVEMKINPARLKEQGKELEEKIKYLEHSEKWDDDAQLLEETFKTYFEANGIIEVKDTDRMLAIIKRYLYCGEAKAEEAALSALHKYDNHDYEKWTYEFVLYQWENLDFDWSIGRMEYLGDDYAYEPAKEKLKEWKALRAGKAAPKDEDDECDDESSGRIDYEDVYGYGRASNMAEHRDTFTENDLFYESDVVIIRAYSNGYIYIRFKKECEKAYNESLDFLNALMKKGYSRVHDGYELFVRFLAQPIFFEEMKDYLWPSNDSHAFFAKAVHYPALREKVAEFARFTLKMFDRYRNLDGEYSTVAGTFAAVAASMSDVKYMDVALKFAEETDDEHEELASHFCDILEDYYGVTPQTAAAIAMLRLSYGHDDLGLPDDFYKYPENLQAVIDYFSSTPMHHESHKVVRVMNNVFGDAESGLKKLKKLFKDSSDPSDKMIYADAHDWLLEALEEEEDESFGKPIGYKPLEKEVEKTPVDEEGADFTENPPCVITFEEAKRRGYKDEEIDREDDAGWCAFIFGPAIFTNPYHYDIYWENINKLMGIKPRCFYVNNPSTAFSLRQCVLDFKGAPYEFGMTIFDKKKAEMIYGLMDYAAIATAMNNKPADKAKLMGLRKQYLIELGSKGSPSKSFDMPGVKLVDEAISAKNKEKYMRALMKLNQVNPEMGDAYISALIIKGSIYKKQGCTAEAKTIYTELVLLKPEFHEYWEGCLQAME